MWLSSEGDHRMVTGSSRLFGWEIFHSCSVFLPEVTALSTVSAATGTSASLEMKIVHLLTTSLKVHKIIRKL